MDATSRWRDFDRTASASSGCWRLLLHHDNLSSFIATPNWFTKPNTRDYISYDSVLIGEAVLTLCRTPPEICVYKHAILVQTKTQKWLGLVSLLLLVYLQILLFRIYLRFLKSHRCRCNLSYFSHL